jgi:hypothetical protein
LKVPTEVTGERTVRDKIAILEVNMVFDVY